MMIMLIILFHITTMISLYLIDSGSAGKEWFAKEHLGQDAAETPHVDPEGVTLGCKKDLGCPAHQHEEEEEGGDGHGDDDGEVKVSPVPPGGNVVCKATVPFCCLLDL